MGRHAWHALGTGLDSCVYALAVDGSGNLYAGGEFTTAGGVSANHVAKWDGSDVERSRQWAEQRMSCALAVDGSGNLYAGGEFTTAGGVSANYVAKWDGRRLVRPRQRAERRRLCPGGGRQREPVRRRQLHGRRRGRAPTTSPSGTAAGGALSAVG